MENDLENASKVFHSVKNCEEIHRVMNSYQRSCENGKMSRAAGYYAQMSSGTLTKVDRREVPVRVEHRQLGKENKITKASFVPSESACSYTKEQFAVFLDNKDTSPVNSSLRLADQTIPRLQTK